MTVLDLIARGLYLLAFTACCWVLVEAVRNPPGPIDPMDGARERIARQHRDSQPNK